MAGRLAFGVVAFLACLGVTACSSADRVVTGDRPTTSVPAPDWGPRSPVALDELPGWQSKAPDGEGYSRPMVGGTGHVRWATYDQQSQPLGVHQSDQWVGWGAPQEYSEVPGVLTFRGDNARTSPTYGTADITDKTLQIVWTHDTGAVFADGSYFPGAGWTGQPLLVNWPAEAKRAMGLTSSQIDDPGFVEVIYPVFDGLIHRLDLATGNPTKPPIDAGWGFKGTGSIDPRGYPLLYAGQGLDENGDRKGPWEFRIFDLIQSKQVAQISGTDQISRRQDPVGWGAFDSSALIDRHSDTLIEPGENGVIYQARLNTSFDPVAKQVSVDPTIIKMVYSTPQSQQHGIESSAAAWRNLMYANDNDGNLICWDATTLQVVWAHNFADNADSTPVLADEGGHPYLYTGNSVGWRGALRKDQVTNLVKVDGLTGEVVWQHDLSTYYSFAVKGGLLSTPLLGQGEQSELVIFNVAKTTAPSEGTLLALDRATGGVVWSRNLAHYSWSSPVMIHGSDGHEYGVFGDSAGLLHLFDPATGADYSTVSLGKNVEASVAAYDNMLVVASYDQKIFGIRVG